ncbi:MAG: FAD-binding oxidoreductase [Chloroflexota bacterium]
MRYFSARHNNGRNLRPPDLYEYFVDNFWFETVDLDNQTINAPLRGRHKADVVIIGGGYTGLSSAYHLKRQFPEKHIVILEGACCGYGASGRNGGFCVTDIFLDQSRISEQDIPDAVEVSFYGLNQIKRLIAEHNIECDFRENGMLEVALNDQHIQSLAEQADRLRYFGLDVTLMDGDQLKGEIKSPIFKAGLKMPHGATLNPAKLAREMKRVVEALGVEVRERSVVTRVSPGKLNLVDTELGEIEALILVIALNAYAHKLGFFRDHVFPVVVHQIATAPLTTAQWAAIGWQNRKGLSDHRPLYSYSIPTVDGRIVLGGVDFTYYDYDGLGSGNDKVVTRLIEEDLFTYFPQLEGLKIEHTWSGTTAYSLSRIPSVGVTGEHQNVYFGVGFSNGVPSAQTAGRIIADLMAGKSNKFTNHYIVNHKIPYAGPTATRGFFGKLYKWRTKTFGW